MSVAEWLESRSGSARRGRAEFPAATIGSPAGHRARRGTAAPRGPPPTPRGVTPALRRTHARTDQRSELSQEGDKQTMIIHCFVKL